jgi:hypothetical protein
VEGGSAARTDAKFHARIRGRLAASGLERYERQLPGMFAQILGKFYFFNLSENLRHILLDYEEKRSCTTNGAFKCAC